MVGSTHVFEITGAGERLDRALADLLPDLSRAYIQRLIKEGEAWVDEIQVTKPSFRLEGGRSVRLYIPPVEPQTIESEDIPLDVVYEDNEVVVIDNLSGGYRQAVDKRADFELADLANEKTIEKIFKKYQFSAVIRFAGVISMGESMENPAKYFRINVFNALNLFEAMIKHQVLKLIFSSTAGVYGDPVRLPIPEDDSKNPTNPYGESKLMVEKMLDWYDKIFNFRSILLFIK